MNSALRLLAPVALVCCATSREIPQGTADQRAEVLRRVQAFADAFRAADAPALESLLAPDYAHTNGGRPVLTREQWLSYVRSRRAQITSGALVITRYENVEVEARVYHDTAVVTGMNRSEGVADGKPFSSELRFTQVWRRTNDRWVRWAFQDAPVPKQ